MRTRDQQRQDTELFVQRAVSTAQPLQCVLMTALIVTVGAIAIIGYAVGAVLSVVAWRTPRGIPLDRSMWAAIALPGRNGTAGREMPPPFMELLTSLLYIATAVRFGVSWPLPAYLWLCTAAALLAVIDVRHQRLPNAIVGPFAVGALILLTVSAIGDGSWAPLLRAATGAAALFVIYLVLALISPSSLGMGDVKLAAVLGLYLAYIGWRTLFLGAAGAFVIAAAVAIVLLITRRAGRRTQIPFGPSMLAAALIAILAG